MRYTYTTTFLDGSKDVCTKFEEVCSLADKKTVEVYDNLEKRVVVHLWSGEEMEDWSDKLAKDLAWHPTKPPVTVNVNNSQEGVTTQPIITNSSLKTTKRPLDSMTLQDLKPKDHINPDHYKGYIEEMQWLDAMSRIPTLRSPERFKAAIELQIRKYMDRNGGKDPELRELQKALFYLKYLVAYIKNNCKPIHVKDVEELLAKK